jgi:hypothetical protein
MIKFYYKAFGLKIISDFEITSFYKDMHFENANVIIRSGNISNKSILEGKDRFQYFSQGDTFYLNVPDVAAYQVKNGLEIIVEKCEKCQSDNTVMLFLLGSTFGALLHQRGVLLLHGCSVKTDKGAVVIIGPSGIGKSTLSGGLYIKYGLNMLADDVSPLIKGRDDCPQSSVIDNSMYFVVPSYPGMKLWKDSMEFLGEKINSIEKFKPELDKYRYCFHKDFSHDLIPLHKIYLLSYSDKDDYYIDSINEGIEKFKILKQNIYRYEYVKEIGKGLENFEQLIDLAKSAEIKKISRPSKNSNIEKLLELVISDIKK